MEPSNQSSHVGSTLPTQISPPSDRDDASVSVGRNAQGQGITQTQHPNSIPEASGDPIHRQKPSSETFQNVTETQVESFSTSAWKWTTSWFTNKTVESTSATSHITHKNNKSSAARAVSTRTVEETPITASTNPSWWQSHMPTWMGGKVEKTEGREYIPQGSRPIENKESAFTRFLKDAVQVGTSAANWISGGKLQSTAGNWGSWGTRKLLEAKAKTTFPNMTDDQFKALLGELTALISDTMSESPTSRYINIPEIKINVGLPDPVRIRNLRFKASPAHVQDNCALIHTQDLKRSVRVEDLECFVDIPRPDQEPAELQILMDQGVVTIGSDLKKVLNNINTWDVTKAATWSGFKNIPLDMDNTAVQVETPKLTVKFSKLNSASASGLLAFDKGEAVLKNITLSRPLSLKKPSNQSTILQCGGFTLKNQRSRECLVDLKKIDVPLLDETLSGHASAEFSLDLGKVKHFPDASKAVKHLQGIHLDCNVELDIKEGEIDFTSLKKGLKIKQGKHSSPKSWFVSWVINAVLGADETRIYKNETGQNRLDVGFSTPVLGWLIGKIAGRYLTNIPLPGTMAVGREGTDGQLIGTNIISMVVTGILNGWFMAPAQVHVIRKDHEQMCNAAAAGDISASRGLMTTIKKLEDMEHTDETIRMLEAIPAEHFNKIYDEAEIIPKEWVSHLARNLAAIDPDKAIAIYAKIMSKTELEDLPETVNVQKMMNRAYELYKQDPAAKATAIDMFEFMALAKPESGAAEHLVTLTQAGEYPVENIVQILPQSLRSPYYISHPEEQIALLLQIESKITEYMPKILEYFPTQQIETNYRKNALDAERHLASLEKMAVKHNCSVFIAKVLDRVGNEERAKKLLATAISSGDKTALQYRIAGEIEHARYGQPQYISAFNLLSKLLANKPISMDLQSAAVTQMASLWKNTRGKAIQWPYLKPLPEDFENPGVTGLQQSLTRLFGISADEFNTPKTLLLKLNEVREELSKVITHCDLKNPVMVPLSNYSQLVDELAEEVNQDQQLQELIDYTYDHFSNDSFPVDAISMSSLQEEERQEGVFEIPDLLDLFGVQTPTTAQKQHKTWGASAIRMIGKAITKLRLRFRNPDNDSGDIPDLIDLS